jgi:HK97 family phage prohead protease
MPYFISDSADGCSGWATVKDDGEVIGCHTTKQAAIDHMVAISIAEDIEPGGERALPSNYRPALAPDVPDGRACGNCYFYDETNVRGDKAWCEKWDEYVSGAYYCNAWQPHEEGDHDEMRAPSVPQYIRAAAAKGLEYNRAGRGGDGLTDQTLREARLLADGTVSDDKIIRAAAWGARHAVDLEPAKNSNSNDREFPGAGAVAHYLWGINPLDPMPARDWFERQADMIKEASRGIDMTKIETREVQVQDLELREAPSGGMTFRGYAAVFNSDSQPLPFIEQISPGAFNRTLANRRNNVKMFVNHDDTMVLATTRAATLRLSEDSRGLIAEADLPDTTYGRDLSVLMQRGDVDSMSFGFSVPSGGDQWSNDGGRRTLNEVRLHEVSIVTGFPAYEATTATVRKVQHLATRTATDAEALADAMLALEAGQLTDDQANLLRSVVDKIGPEMEAQPTAPLSLLSQKLDLMLKAV